MPAPLQILDQLARALHRLDLADQLHVERLLGRADLIAKLALGALIGQRGDQLVTAHPDVAMDPPQREHDLVLSKRTKPRDRVVIVRVDQRSVDVEDRDYHVQALPAIARCNPTGDG